jgi:hypothetical protein
MSNKLAKETERTVCTYIYTVMGGPFFSLYLSCFSLFFCLLFYFGFTPVYTFSRVLTGGEARQRQSLSVYLL